MTAVPGVDINNYLFQADISSASFLKIQMGLKTVYNEIKDLATLKISDYLLLYYFL